MEVTGIAAGILAGGKNARMFGRNKAFIKINGEPVIQRALAVLKKNFTEIILVTNSPELVKINGGLSGGEAELTVYAKDLLKKICKA